jgi:hypothetical protein
MCINCTCGVGQSRQSTARQNPKAERVILNEEMNLDQKDMYHLNYALGWLGFQRDGGAGKKACFQMHNSAIKKQPLWLGFDRGLNLGGLEKGLTNLWSRKKI